MPDATTAPIRPLLPELLALLAAHRPAFRQERTARRSEALLLGWLCAFGRHTITQVLLALGLGRVDWTAWYRLFSRERVAYDQLSACLLAQTLPLAAASGPYLVAVDATQLPRRSQTMPGTTWLRHPATAIFRAGIHRAQRFVHLAWLPLPSAAGYSRAVPLRWESAFPAKAVPATGHPPRKEWEAGLVALAWTRAQLDAQQRPEQRLLGIGDGSYSTRHVWAGLPAGVDLLARCAKNRALYALPGPYPGTGRRRRYGDRGPRPDAWLGQRHGWRQATLAVRGRAIPITYRVEGPYLVKGAHEQPLYLLVVKGIDQRARRKRRREPSLWLISAVADDQAGWVLRRTSGRRPTCWPGRGNGGRSRSPIAN